MGLTDDHLLQRQLPCIARRGKGLERMLIAAAAGIARAEGPDLRLGGHEDLVGRLHSEQGPAAGRRPQCREVAEVAIGRAEGHLLTGYDAVVEGVSTTGLPPDAAVTDVLADRVEHRTHLVRPFGGKPLIDGVNQGEPPSRLGQRRATGPLRQAARSRFRPRESRLAGPNRSASVSDPASDARRAAR